MTVMIVNRYPNTISEEDKENIENISKEQEKWEYVHGGNGKYLISNIGRVYSLITHALRKASLCDGYPAMPLAIVRGKKKLFLVHRMVAEAFIPNPDNLPQVNHKDEDRQNCHVDNLEWCTAQYNATYNDAHIKRGNSLKGRPAHNKGKTNFMSESARKKISEARKKATLSKAHKDKISESLKQYHRQK